MRAAAVLAGLLLARGALACGYCVEDKIAATYDHAVIVRAADRRHEVVFLSLEGALARTQERAVARAVESTAGVDPGTVRVSLENGAVSFAFDPSRGSLDSIVGGVRSKLAAKGAGVSVLRVLGERL
jgi:hypothetical protein